MPRGIYTHKPASAETKKKMSLSKKGHILSAETRKKISEGQKRSIENLGYKHSPEARAKMSQTRRGKRYSISTEFKKGFTPWNKGISTDEQKARSRKSIILRHKYGIDLDQYEELFKNQNGVCMICDEPETKKSVAGKIAPLHIDHDHKTGRIRGLLCHKCNCAIGMFCDDIKLLKKAIKYLSL